MQIKLEKRTIDEIIQDGEHQDKVDTSMEVIYETVKRLEENEYPFELICNSMLYTATQLFLDQFKNYNWAYAFYSDVAKFEQLKNKNLNSFNLILKKR